MTTVYVIRLQNAEDTLLNEHPTRIDAFPTYIDALSLARWAMDRVGRWGLRALPTGSLYHGDRFVVRLIITDEPFGQRPVVLWSDPHAQGRMLDRLTPLFPGR